MILGADELIDLGPDQLMRHARAVVHALSAGTRFLAQRADAALVALR